MKYIHYGSNEFDINRFEKIRNEEFISINKPSGGLWASRVGINTGWKDWCKQTGFRTDFDKYFIFSLKEDTKILIISSIEQLHKIFNPEDIITKCIDFEELSKEYDAIKVFISTDRKLYFSLYGWDCDSIIVMNPSKIILEK